MDCSHVERVIAISDAEEACRLLKGLWPDSWNLQNLGARSKPSLFIAITHNVLRVRSEIPATKRSSVQDDVFRSTPTRFTQLSITFSNDSCN